MTTTQKAHLEPTWLASYIVGTHPDLTTTFIDREIDGLRRLGADIAVVSLRPARPNLSPSQQNEVSRVRYLLPTTPLAVAKAHIWAALSRPRRYAHSLLRLMRADHAGASHRRTVLHWLEGVSVAHLLRDRDGVDIHAHFVDRAATVALVAAELLGSTYSVTAHADDIYVSPTLLDLKFGGSRLAITCTDYNRQHLRSVLSPEASRNVIRVPHGLTLSAYDPAPRTGDGRLVASVAQLKQKKGLRYLIEACAMLHEEGAVVACQIAGDGPLRAELQAAIEGSAAADDVTLLGSVSHPLAIDLLQRASVFALPSIIAEDGARDGIPNVILEAMAMALPVISTPTSGIPEVLKDGVNGILVDTADPRALADAIRHLMDDRDLRERMGAAGRAFVEKEFDLSLNAVTFLTAQQRSHL